MNLADLIDASRDQHLAELCEFLRIPSVSAKSEHKPDIERGANWVAGNLRAAGLKNVEIVPTALHPLVYAESLEAPGKPTILFYGHYDVQPPEPLDLWTSPPFDPTVRNGNLFGRGTADDKGQGHIHLLAVYFLQGFEGFQVNVDLALVVGGAAAKEIAIPHGGFERRRGPKIEGLGRLHVVVAVEKDGRLTRGFQGFRVDERVEIRWDDLHVLESGGAKMIGDPASAALDVRFVFTLGADAGDAEKCAQLREMLVALTFDKFSKVHKGPSGDRSPFENECENLMRVFGATE